MAPFYQALELLFFRWSDILLRITIGRKADGVLVDLDGAPISKTFTIALRRCTRGWAWPIRTLTSHRVLSAYLAPLPSSRRRWHR
jgi:hypothetical protein